MKNLIEQDDCIELTADEVELGIKDKINFIKTGIMTAACIKFIEFESKINNIKTGNISAYDVFEHVEFRD